MKKLKMTFVFCIIFLLTVFCFTEVFAEASEKNYTLTDYHSDTTYYVTVSEDGVVIESEGFYKLIPVDTPVLSCSVSNSIIYILTYTKISNSHTAAYYSFDTKNSNLAYILSDLPVAINENRFAVDSNNNLYLVDRYNNNVVNRWYNNEITSFDMESTVEQLLCLDGENVSVITTKGMFLIEGSQNVKTSSVVPVTPCAYTGNGIIEDRAGIRFTYENGALKEIESEASISETTAPLPTDNQTISVNGSYIFAEQGVTVAKLYKSLGINKDALTVYKKDGTLFSQGKLGTCMKVTFDSKTYTFIIYGELTGEGNINSKDLNLLMKHLTGEENLNTTESISADINKDGKICTKDLLLLSRMY